MSELFTTELFKKEPTIVEVVRNDIQFMKDSGNQSFPRVIDKRNYNRYEKEASSQGYTYEKTGSEIVMHKRDFKLGLVTRLRRANTSSSTDMELDEYWISIAAWLVFFFAVALIFGTPNVPFE